MERCIFSTIDLVSQKTGLKTNYFDINYRDAGRTLKTFKKHLAKKKEVVYCTVGFDADKLDTSFTINNQMLNWTEQPEYAHIDIHMTISTQFAELIAIEEITEKLITSFDFEYGYITKLPSNYDDLTERKMKRGLFSSGVQIKASDKVWIFHSVGLREGYIKRLYPINYLNQSHLANSETKEVMQTYGVLESISDTISKWSLSSAEVKELKNNEHIKSISVMTPDLAFLKTAKAKELNAKMELKNHFKP
jgi:hypothetical protein